MIDIATIDLIFIIILLIFIIKATIRGFISEFFSKAAVIVGGIISIVFYKHFTPIIEKFIGEQIFSPVISFLILFLVTYLIIKLLEILLGSLFTNASLKSLDRALGFFLGIIEGLLIIITILIIINIQPFFDTKNLLSNSIIAKIIIPLISDIKLFV